jgi:adenylate kinase family enzyme
VIVGCGGSGKTGLANQLASLLGLPVVHLDGIYYDDEWNQLPHAEFATRQHDLIAKPRWIIDGNYAATLPIRLAAADTVIFLDLPAISCLAGVVRRRWRYRGGQHHDGVYDRITWCFVRYIWRYRQQMRPKVHRLLDQHCGTAEAIVLTSRRQITDFVNHIEAHALPT